MSEVKGETMKKIVVLVTLLAFVCVGSVALAAAAKDQVCCKDGKVLTVKDPADCAKQMGKMVPKDACKPAPAKK